jgi:DNA-binding GntR family transcriptional regulator
MGGGRLRVIDLQLSPRNALGEQVAAILRRAILDGTIKPGQLLHENVLAKQLSVSRSPIREALLQLERENLCVSRPNKPAEVRRPSPEEIRQTYTLRAVLEGVAAHWTAEKATPDLVATLRENAELLNQATVAAEGHSDPSLTGKAIEFHNAISLASGSNELQRMLQSLCNQIHLVMSAGLANLTSRRAEEIHAEHLAIIDASAEGDGDSAEKLARAHVEGARERLIHLI